MRSARAAARCTTSPRQPWRGEYSSYSHATACRQDALRVASEHMLPATGGSFQWGQGQGMHAVLLAASGGRQARRHSPPLARYSQTREGSRSSLTPPGSAPLRRRPVATNSTSCAQADEACRRGTHMCQAPGAGRGRPPGPATCGCSTSLPLPPVHAPFTCRPAYLNDC